MLFSRTYKGSSDFSYAAEPVGAISSSLDPSNSGDKSCTLIPLDNHIRDTISQRGCGASITLLHPSSQLNMCLFTHVVRFRESFCDHELRHIDLVLKEVGNNLFRVAGSAVMLERYEGEEAGQQGGSRLGFIHVSVD